METVSNSKPEQRKKSTCNMCDVRLEDSYKRLLCPPCFNQALEEEKASHRDYSTDILREEIQSSMIESSSSHASVGDEPPRILHSSSKLEILD
ncbi:hypothetical protein GDO78_008323 [Eleutherodactylus coqui]|uniref:Uncharacterized protein n=1 Tax=Eleutherodactylus coqui TaxID=57060 RepID=A0A8J6FEK2_ELECQ|nr:hypothetical protein GDO78_008323 [Eleutherodactylus coqui]